MISNLMAVVLSKLFGKKNITSVHTYYRLSDKKSTFHNTSKITSWIFNNSDAIFVLQKAAKQDIINLGVNPTKIIILNYWIDTNLFKPMDKKKIRKEFGISGDFVALFVARLVDVKGVDLIAEVAEKASDDITFVFVGDGPKRDVVEKVAKKNNVYFLGFMPLSEMPKIFNIGDVLLWGSIDEDFVGITTRNALSCGLPVISSNEAVFFNIKRKTDKRSFPEEIFHITEPKAAEIIDVLKEIKNSKKKLISASKKSREYAIKMYGIKNAEIIYNKIIELCKPT